jgi:hypothetical protein
MRGAHSALRPSARSKCSIVFIAAAYTISAVAGYRMLWAVAPMTDSDVLPGPG